MIRILIVDDQAIIRQGLRVLLTIEPDFDVVGEAENGQVAIAQVQALKPDVVLMDLRMPVKDGIAATEEISQTYQDTKVIVLTTFNEDDLVDAALKVGAMGYLLKDTPSEDLATVIRSVYKGYSQYSPGLIQKAVTRLSTRTLAESIDPPSGFEQLTTREKQILLRLAKGANNREIAQAFFITDGTVRNHVTSILGRLNLRDRTQAALWGQRILPLLEKEVQGN